MHWPFTSQLGYVWGVGLLLHFVIQYDTPCLG